MTSLQCLLLGCDFLQYHLIDYSMNIYRIVYTKLWLHMLQCRLLNYDYLTVLSAKNYDYFTVSSAKQITILQCRLLRRIWLCPWWRTTPSPSAGSSRPSPTGSLPDIGKRGIQTKVVFALLGFLLHSYSDYCTARVTTVLYTVSVPTALLGSQLHCLGQYYTVRFITALLGSLLPVRITSTTLLHYTTLSGSLLLLGVTDALFGAAMLSSDFPSSVFGGIIDYFFAFHTNYLFAW